MLVLNLVAAAGTGVPVAGVVHDWPQGLLAVQVVFLLVVGPLRVVSAIRADVTSRMIESHRLMPLDPVAVVSGYVFGGPWSALVLFATTFAFGTGCCLLGGGDPSAWLIANGLLAVAAACVWVVTAHLTMVSRFCVLLMVVVAVFALGGDDGPGQLLPGFGVLSATLVTRSALVLRRPTFAAEAWTVAVAAQVVVAAVSGRAAVRLYRTPAAIGLSPPLGLTLLAVWVAVSALGIGWPEVFTFVRRSRGPGPATQLVASVVTALLIAALPVAAAAKTAARHRAAAAADDDDTTPAGRQPVSPVVSALAAAALVSLLAVLVWAAVPSESLFELPDPGRAGRAVRVTPAVVLAAVFGLLFVFQWVYVRWERAWPSAVAWLFATWAVPLIVDAAVNVDSRDGFGRVGTLSPVGALVVLWTRSGTDPSVGIALQFALAAVAAGLYVTTLAARRRRGVTAWSSHPA